MLPVRVVAGRGRRQAWAGRRRLVVMMRMMLVVVVVIVMMIVFVVVMVLGRPLDVDVRVLPALVVVTPDRRARDGDARDEGRRHERREAQESPHPCHLRGDAPDRMCRHHSSSHAKMSGATMDASDSMMCFGVSSPSLPHVIFSFGTAPE
jgi:hypothetical protein